MFFPCKISFSKKLPTRPKSKGKKAAALICAYGLALAATFGAAKEVTAYSVNSLYAVYTKESATISLCEIDTDKLKKIINIALSNDDVKNRINWENGETKFLNYVLPSEWYAAEVPMSGVQYRAGHLSPSDYDDTRYKIIFTIAEIRGNTEAIGKEIVTTVLTREPLIEVWIDLDEQMVIQVLEIPDDYKYQGIPVAVF